MAYGVKKINPLDLRPSIGVGVKIPFSNRTGFMTVYSTKEQIKYNLINYLLTNKRERPFNLNFGANLREKLFEQLTEDLLLNIEQDIRSGVESNFPNVEVVKLAITPYEDENSIKIEFSYRILNTDEEDNIKLLIQN